MEKITNIHEYIFNQIVGLSEERDEMIENEIDDAIEEKHEKNESDFDKYKGELDWDRPEE